MRAKGARMPGPTITVIDKTDKQKDWGIKIDDLVVLLQKFVDEHFAPVWLTPCVLKKAADFEKGSWALAFFDEPDQPDVLGYHDLTPEGLPLGKIAVGAVLRSGKQVSVTATHELAEMLLDPGANLIVQGADNTLYAFEVCDAVEEETFQIDGHDVSSFVYPAWFAAAGGSRYVDAGGRLDKLGHTMNAFQILPRGYMPIYKDGWTQTFGSIEKQADYANEDRRERRFERRRKRSLKRSEK